MIKDTLVDIVKDLLKFVAGFAIPVGLVLLGAAIVAIGWRFENITVVGAGAVVALCGVVWGLFLFLWHSNG